MKRFSYIATCLLMLSWLPSCKSDVPSAKNVVQPNQVKGAAPLPKEAEEAKAEREVYNYEPKGRRDPFLSLVDVAKEKPQRKKGATPVENFDISELRLSAIVWDRNQFYALMTLPDNKSYTIKRGMVLGLYGGKVEEITKNAVLIREQIKDYRGQFKTKETVLRLRKEGEE